MRNRYAVSEVIDERPSLREEVKRQPRAQTSVLWVGFTALLLLMVLVAVRSTESVAQLAQLNAKARADSALRDHLLDQMGLDISHAATVSRDSLLETDDRNVASHRKEIEVTRQRVYDALQTYDDQTPDEENAALAALRQDLDRFWTSVEPSLSLSGSERETRASEYLDLGLDQRQSDVVQLLATIQTLNQRTTDSAEKQLRAATDDLRWQITLISSLIFLGGLAVAWFSIRRIRRLEEEAEDRYTQMEQARKQLRELSNSLVNAQEEERRHLSRELHDELGQTMSALVTDIAHLEKELPKNREALGRIRQLAESNVRSVRDIALLLRPSMLDDLGLNPALNWQAREVRRRHGLKVRLVTDDLEEKLSDAHRTCIYRLVQEALNNCVKHACATEAEVVVRRDASTLAVSVRDNGKGFDAAKQKGVGLLGMEERVIRLGGLFHIESHPGQGTVVSVLFPNLIELETPEKEQLHT
jgi:signal transduction histidine kinase